MKKGDIVLIIFPFTNLSGSKLRPALILAKTNLDISVCFISTQIGWQESTDVLINPSQENGIKKQSLIRTSKIATLDISLVKGILGTLNVNEIKELNFKIKLLFDL